MALHDRPSLEPRSFRLPDLGAVREVFEAAFSQATTVKGAFGWFNAGWIGILAYGLAEYLERDDTSPIEFTIAPTLFSAEYDALAHVLSTGGGESSGQEPLDLVVAELARGADPSSPPVTRHAVAALCWMVANGRLQLNVAFPKATSNYHPKVWLFEDGADAVVIRGSANATRRGMDAGIEHLDVDCSWRDRYRVAEYGSMVHDWSTGADEMLLETVPLDLDLLRDRIAVMADDADLDVRRRPSRRQLDDAIEQERDMPDPDLISGFAIPPHIQWQDGPFSHQSTAVRAWEATGGRGLFSIATGGGKTIAANICAQRLYERQVVNGARKPLLILVSAPTTILISQWDEEMRKFGLAPYTPTLGTKAARQETLGNLMATLGLETADPVIPIIVTNNRMSDPGFQRSIRMGVRMARAAGKDPLILHIGDEAHTLGAKGFVENIPDFVDMRLGLSATPIRQYDEEGSTALLRYFGQPELEDPEDAIVFEFGLHDAIACGALVPYDYHVDVVHLDGEEMARYRDLTTRIGKKVAMGADLDSDDTGLTALLMERRSVLETAQAKLGWLRQLLGTIDTSRMLLYASSKNPAQFDAAHELLHRLEISHHQVTQETTANARRLDSAMTAFAEGAVDCLIAKKVLDEGVNVPTTGTAVLLASSTTEREWIQRLGRVLRTAPGKDRAAIYDVLALPPPTADVRADDTSQHLVKSELTRVRRIAECSQTQDLALQTVWDIEAEYLR